MTSTISHDESLRLLGQVRTFADLDAATRLSALMSLPPEQQQAVLINLVFETHAKQQKLEQEVIALKADVRRLRVTKLGVQAVAHTAAAVAGGLMGIFAPHVK